MSASDVTEPVGQVVEVSAVSAEAPTAAETPAAAEPPAVASDSMSTRAHRKTRRGVVISNKMAKTVVVRLDDRVKHPLYGKVLTRYSRVKAHDEEQAAGLGDQVLIMETRPLSATKHWRVVEILEKAK